MNPEDAQKILNQYQNGSVDLTQDRVDQLNNIAYPGPSTQGNGGMSINSPPIPSQAAAAPIPTLPVSTPTPNMSLPPADSSSNSSPVASSVEEEPAPPIHAEAAKKLLDAHNSGAIKLKQPTVNELSKLIDKAGDETSDKIMGKDEVLGRKIEKVGDEEADKIRGNNPILANKIEKAADENAEKIKDTGIEYPTQPRELKRLDRLGDYNNPNNNSGSLLHAGNQLGSMPATMKPEDAQKILDLSNGGMIKLSPERKALLGVVASSTNQKSANPMATSMPKFSEPVPGVPTAAVNAATPQAPAAPTQTPNTVQTGHEQPYQAQSSGPTIFNPMMGGAGGYRPGMVPKELVDATTQYGQSAMGNMDQQKQNLQDEADAAQKNNLDMALQNDINTRDMSAKDKSDDEGRKYRLMKAQKGIDDLDAMSKQLSAYHEDPDHYWNNRTTGQKILAGIGLFLGSFGHEGGNKAIPVIQSAIDKDIAAQRENYGAQKSGYQAKSSVYGKMMEKFGDEQAADLASKSALIDQAKRKMDQLAFTSQSNAVQAGLQRGKAALDAQQAEIKKQLAYSLYVLNHPPAQATGGGVFYNGADEVKPENVADIDGQHYDFGDKEVAQKAREHASEINQVSSAAEEMKGLIIKNKGGGVMSSEDRARYDALANTLHMQVPSFLSGRQRLNEKEIEIAQDIAGGKNDWFRGDLLNQNVTKLNVLSEIGKKRKAEVLSDGMPVQQGLAQGKKGSPALTRAYRYQNKGLPQELPPPDTNKPAQ